MTETSGSPSQRDALRQVLHGAVETMHLGVTVVDSEGTILYVNRAEALMHGYAVAELLGRPSRILGEAGARSDAPETPPDRRVHWERETVNVRKDGSRFPVRLISDPVKDAEGRTLLVTICEDLSETRQALAASERRYRDLVETASDLIVTLSPEGRVDFANRAWLEAMGRQEGGLEGLGEVDFLETVHPDQRETCKKLLRRVWSERSAAWLETVFVNWDGREILVEGSLGIQRGAGEPVGILGIFHNVTERSAVEQMKDEFLSLVNHELRTPLTSIVASLDLLGELTQEDPFERSVELISIARRNSDRLLALVSDVLDMQQLRSGRLRLKMVPTGLADVMRQAVEQLDALGGWRDVRFEIESGPDLVVPADQRRLRQVLVNLLSNAVKVSPPGGAVTVSAKRIGRRARLSVADQGPGIPEEFLDRLFDRFTQADASRTRTVQGSGLGLSIVHELIHAMGGTVGVDSVVDEGSTFYVELPQTAPAAPDESTAGAPESPAD